MLDRSVMKNPMEILEGIIATVEIPPLNKSAWKNNREKFTYICVRDTLIQMNVKLARAEHLASTHAGGPRRRLKACLEHIK